MRVIVDTSVWSLALRRNKNPVDSVNKVFCSPEARYVKAKTARYPLFIFALFLLTPLVSSPLVAQNPSKVLIEAARERTLRNETYDGSYRVIAYPNGDVPDDRGVCTDLVIRAYRSLKIDLQVLVHEDMRGSFKMYPQFWGLKKPDSNIDHRRVPNLQKFFERRGARIPVSQNPDDYQAGDLVTWMLPGNLPHIGIVSDRSVLGSERPRIIHNIGAGPVENDILFLYPITGHYRFYPERGATDLEN